MVANRQDTTGHMATYHTTYRIRTTPDKLNRYARCWVGIGLYIVRAQRLIGHPLGTKHEDGGSADVRTHKASNALLEILKPKT